MKPAASIAIMTRQTGAFLAQGMLGSALRRERAAEQLFARFGNSRNRKAFVVRETLNDIPSLSRQSRRGKGCERCARNNEFSHHVSYSAKRYTIGIPGMPADDDASAVSVQAVLARRVANSRSYPPAGLRLHAKARSPQRRKLMKKR
jgi:hypothetical protein